MSSNHAIDTNPPNGTDIHITRRGSSWLWAVFSIMAVSDLIIIGWHFMVPRGQRVFHQLAAIILTTASIAYFAMASDLGFAAITTEFSGHGFPAGTYRQIWYTRYIDWVITTPALLLELVLASALPLSDIITLIFFDLVMIITGLIGALVPSRYKFGFFAFGCAALFYIWWALLGPARTSARTIGAPFKRSLTISAAYLSFIWLLYPIAWGVSDGGNVISPDSEMVFYGILDLLAKPVFCFLHLWQLSRLALTLLQLRSGKFSAYASDTTTLHNEKVGHHGAGTTGVTAGPGRHSDATVVDNDSNHGVGKTNKTSRFGLGHRHQGAAPALTAANDGTEPATVHHPNANMAHDNGVTATRNTDVA